MWWIELRIGLFDTEGGKKVMANQMKFKIYFEVLCNCEKWLLRRIRTQDNTSKFIQTAQIIFGKPDLLFIDGQIQQCKEYVYPVMIKPLLEIILFTTFFAKKGLVLVGVLLAWDSRIQKTNPSHLSIMKDQLTNQLANIFRKYLQKELSINV